LKLRRQIENLSQIDAHLKNVLPNFIPIRFEMTVAQAQAFLKSSKRRRTSSDLRAVPDQKERKVWVLWHGFS